MKEMTENSETPKDPIPPKIPVFRKNSNGETVEMEAGIQPPLLDEPVDGTEIQTQYVIKGKPIMPIEREVAEVAHHGHSLPETRQKAERQRRAIKENYERRRQK